ncbi:MAG: hypothetical protein ACK5NG_09705 [Chthoniobacterales bacterium]
MNDQENFNSPPSAKAQYPLERPPFQLTLRMFIMLFVAVSFLILPLVLIYWSAEKELEARSARATEQITDNKSLAPLKTALESQIDAHFSDENSLLDSQNQKITFSAKSKEEAEAWEAKLTTAAKQLGLALLPMEVNQESKVEKSGNILIKRYLISLNRENFEALQKTLSRAGETSPKINTPEGEGNENKQSLLTEITLFINKGSDGDNVSSE